MHNGDECNQPTRKPPKVGDDGLTKHQRYYRRNAERLRRTNAERQKQMRDNVNDPVRDVSSQSHRLQHSKAVQTNQPDRTPHVQDILDHLEGMTATYTKSSLLHLYQGLGGLEDRKTRRLLNLRQRVSCWSSVDGGYLMWNETIDLRVEAAARKSSAALEDAFAHLLLRKVAGQDLLCQLLDFGVDDLVSQKHDTLVLVRSQMHLLSVVSLGLGILEVWMLFVRRRIQQGSTSPTDEQIVADQLCSSLDEMD